MSVLEMNIGTPFTSGTCGFIRLTSLSSHLCHLSHLSHFSHISTTPYSLSSSLTHPHFSPLSQSFDVLCSTRLANQIRAVRIGTTDRVYPCPTTAPFLPPRRPPRRPRRRLRLHVRPQIHKGHPAGPRHALRRRRVPPSHHVRPLQYTRRFVRSVALLLMVRQPLRVVDIHTQSCTIECKNRRNLQMSRPLSCHKPLERQHVPLLQMPHIQGRIPKRVQ